MIIENGEYGISNVLTPQQESVPLAQNTSTEGHRRCASVAQEILCHARRYPMLLQVYVGDVQWYPQDATVGVLGRNTAQQQYYYRLSLVCARTTYYYIQEISYRDIVPHVRYNGVVLSLVGQRTMQQGMLQLVTHPQCISRDSVVAQYVLRYKLQVYCWDTTDTVHIYRYHGDSVCPTLHVLDLLLG